MLLIVGDLDAADSLHAADSLVARADDARSVVLPGAGHMVNLEARSRIDREVDAFLATRAD